MSRPRWPEAFRRGDAVEVRLDLGEGQRWMSARVTSWEGDFPVVGGVTARGTFTKTVKRHREIRLKLPESSFDAQHAKWALICAKDAVASAIAALERAEARVRALENRS